MNLKLVEKIKNSINDNFALSIEYSGAFLIPDDDPEIVNGFEHITLYGNERLEIMNYILNYVKKNPKEFFPDELVHYNGGGKGERPWWSRIPHPGERAGFLATGSSATYTRKIAHISGHSIHPGGVTAEEYQKLKTNVPKFCQIEGCSNNFPHPLIGGETQFIEGEICPWHKNPPNSSPNSNENRRNVIEVNFEELGLINLSILSDLNLNLLEIVI